MRIDNFPRFYESGTAGAVPVVWSGPGAPDGDGTTYMMAPIGSLYIQLSDPVARVWQKVDNNGRDDDWSALGGNHVISQRVTFSQFTDGGSTSGTFALAQQIPAGAFVERTLLENVTGFTGDTSAVLDVGDGTDDDRYNAAAGFNVFGDAVALDGGAPQGTQIHTAAKTPTLTLASNADFTSVAAGAFTIKIFYKL
ncbi:MAG: hypothetical protein U0X20_23770 [Caldilineaceae bacterium]